MLMINAINILYNKLNYNIVVIYNYVKKWRI